MSHGGRGTRRVVMTAGEWGGSVTQAWSADMGMMSVMRREKRAGTGSASVTVHGAGMGLVTYTGRGSGEGVLPKYFLSMCLVLVSCFGPIVPLLAR